MALMRTAFGALCGLAAVAAVATASPALAQRDWQPGPPPPGYGYPPPPPPPHARPGPPPHARPVPPPQARPAPGPAYRQPPRFRREVVYDYFARRQEPYRALPPHIARDLRPGMPLPSGISYRPLPGQLARQLRFCGAGWDCVLVGADMVIVDSRRGIIADVLRGVRR